MQINEVIRKYRKENHLTQEEMANRLGVSTPAVNKWESGNSMPDISLLAPIARLLHISLDELLSFKENLTDIEIKSIVSEIDGRLENEAMDDVFEKIEELVREYPNSEMLILSLSCMVDARVMIDGKETTEKYNEWIQRCYERLLSSDDENIRLRAADCLYSFFLRKGQYDVAEKYLDYFSAQNPERKRKLATIFSETGRFDEAFKALEEVVFSEYQIISGALHGIYMVAMKMENYEKAEYILEKVCGLCDLFDMGAYSRISTKLDYYVAVKDADKVLEIMDSLLETTDTLFDFTKSALYENMIFKKTEPNFMKQINVKLLNQFNEDDSYLFVREAPGWENFKQKWYL